MKKQIVIRTFPQNYANPIENLKKALSEGYEVIMCNKFECQNGKQGNEYILRDDQCEIRGHEALKKNRFNCLRSCSVNLGKTQEQAFFHCWEHYAEIICPSLLNGGHNGGQVSGTFAIVELKNGEVRKILPQYITFVDCEIDKKQKESKEIYD